MTDPDRPSAEEVELPEELVQLCSRTYVKECPDTDLPDGMDSYIDVATVSYRLGLAHGGGKALREAADDTFHTGRLGYRWFQLWLRDRADEIEKGEG